MNAQNNRVRQRSGNESRTFRGVFATALALVAPLSTYGIGFRVANQDAEAIAKGNAFIATADNPSAIYYNPAGITQMQDAQVELGMYVTSINSHFDADAGGSSDTRFEIQGVPQIYCVLPLDNAPKDHPISLGLGIYAPYGLGLQWPGDASLRNKGIEGRIMYVSIAPVAAMELLPGLSFAAGPTLNYSTVKLRSGVGLVPNDTFRYTGHGTALGAKLGLRWQPTEKWALGASWVSPTTVNYDGGSTIKPETQGKHGTKASLDYPQFVMAGISFRPTPHWNLEAGIDWTDWDTLNTVTFEGTAFGSIALPFNWHSTFMAYSGIEYYFQSRYWAAAGYFYSPNVTSDRDFSPLDPDTDLHVASLGFGHKGKRLDWALSAQLITGPSRHVQNGNVADGTYNFWNQAVDFSVTYHF